MSTAGIFDVVASDDNGGVWFLRHAHALFPLTIMPICVSKYSPALSFFQCFRHDLGNLAGEVRQRVVVDHGRVHGCVPAVLLDLAWVLDPVEPVVIDECRKPCGRAVTSAWAPSERTTQ